MKRIILTMSAAVLVIAVAGAQLGDKVQPKLPAIVQKFILARRTARYTGVRVVAFKKGPDRVSHIEYVWKDGPRTRTEFPDDSDYKGQIIVDDGTQRMHYYPDRNEVEVEPAHHRDHEENSIGDHHADFTRTVTPGGKVAGYDTQLVSAADPNGNVMQQMWIEPRTGVRLKLVLYDRVGAQAGSYEFTKINFRPTFAPGDFIIDRRGAVVVTPSMQARRLAERLGLTPLMLDSNSGFELQNARVIHPDNRDVLLQTYVGDAGRFTFFQLRGDVDQSRLARFSRGRLSTYSWKRGEESFAVVGNLNQDQLRQVAKFLGDR